MMLRDGSRELNSGLSEGMPEMWKRLSEKVASVRERILSRIDKTLAHAKKIDEDSVADGHSKTMVDGTRKSGIRNKRGSTGQKRKKA